jgi:hypothetical protein
MPESRGDGAKGAVSLTEDCMLNRNLIGPSLAAGCFALAIAAGPAWAQGRNPSEPGKVTCQQSPNEVDCFNAFSGPEHPQLSSDPSTQANPNEQSTQVGKVGCQQSPNEIDCGNAFSGPEHPRLFGQSSDQNLDSPEPNGGSHKPGHGP